MKNVTKVMITSLVVNSLLAILKIVFGFLAKSKALLADGIHSFSDLSTDIVSIIGNKLAKKEPDLKHPYGHGKLEYLTSIIIGVVILVLGIGLIYNSFRKSTVSTNSIVIIVSILTITFKYILSRYIIKKGNEYKNNILIASGKESSADVISSVIVLISALFMYLSKYNNIFSYADMIASIIVGLFIVKTGFEVLKDNISTIIDEQETDLEYIENVKNIILANDLVKEIDSLVLLKLGHNYKLACDISMDDSLSIKEAHEEIEEIESSLERYDERIKYKTIHINPYKESDK